MNGPWPPRTGMPFLVVPEAAMEMYMREADLLHYEHELRRWEDCQAAGGDCGARPVLPEQHV